MQTLKNNKPTTGGYARPKFPHEMKNERYWRNVTYNDQYLTGVVDTVFKRQGGFASDRQIAVLRRKEMGITTPYHTKN
jgi:hypothetical protein